VLENPIAVIEFLKKHKERAALLGVGLAFLLFIGGGIYLQKSKKQEKEPLPEASSIEVKLSAEPNQTGQSATESTAATTSYFLKPSPEELLEQLASMENLNEAVVDAKFSQLPVLWPGYFFTLRQTEDGRMSLLLDVSEDGFGVVIESEVDLNLYPQLRELASGEKIWIGGKILAVDPTGTGTIYLKTEQLRFGGEAPFLQNHQTTDK
jgi:hypothetical protein